jgi:RNA polymerase sigma-70 factor (ECF subfamily)
VDRAELTRLLVRLKDGDREAFRPAFAVLWPLLRAFTERYAGPGDAEDAAQAALIAVFARAAEFDETRDGAAWALGIAAWECRTLRRRRQRRREEPATSGARKCAASDEMQGAPERASWSDSPEDTALSRELRRCVQQVLGELRPLDVETLLAFGTKSGATYRKRFSRAVARFRMAWRARHGND